MKIVMNKLKTTLNFHRKKDYNLKEFILNNNFNSKAKAFHK